VDEPADLYRLLRAPRLPRHTAEWLRGARARISAGPEGTFIWDPLCRGNSI